MRGKTVDVNCKSCGTQFSARVADRKRGWDKYCSKSCKAKNCTNGKRAYANRHNSERNESNIGYSNDPVEDAFHPFDSHSLGQW